MANNNIRISSWIFASILIVVWFFVGCSPTGKIPGTYSGNSSYMTIILNSDSTFSYRYKFEFSREHAEGRWGLIGNSIVVINSYIKDRAIPIKGDEEHNGSLAEGKHLTINTDMPKSENGFYTCSVFVNDTFFIKRRCDSIDGLKVPDRTASLFIRIKADERIPGRFLDSLETQKYILKDRRSNQVKLSIENFDSLFNYRIFDNVHVRVSKKGIQFPSSYRAGFLFLKRHK